MSVRVSKKIHEHLFDRTYMSGVERDRLRIKATGEVFTPKDLVDEILDWMGNTNPDLFRDPDKTFVDPACGDGEFLAGVLYRKLQNDISLEKALSTLYGVDIMDDNVIECRKRLRCGSDRKKVIETLETNIVPVDAFDFFVAQSRWRF